MKKILALLLTAIMVLSMMVPAVAVEETTAPEAPEVQAVQVKEVTGENNSISYNVRFLSTVNSLAGSALGYEVAALFTDTNGTTKRVVYSVENGDTNMQGNKVYTSIEAVVDGIEKTVTATELAEDTNAKGIFAVAITGVPKALEIVFTIKSYVIYEGKKIESDMAYVKYSQGEMVKVNNAYSQDFSGTNTTKALENLGITRLYNGNLSMRLTDAGNLAIANTAWGSGVFASFVNDTNALDVFQSSRETYIVQMDVSLSRLNIFGFLLNDSSANATDSESHKQNAIQINLRQGTALGTYKAAAISSTNNYNFYWTIDSFSTMESGATSAPKTTSTVIGATSAVDTGLAATSDKLTIAMVVDCSPQNGGTVTLFINGTKSHTVQYNSDDYDVKNDSSLRVWAEGTVAVVDNLSVSVPNAALPAEMTAVPESTAVYSQNFDTGFNYMNQSGIVTPIKACASGGLPLTITDSGELSVTTHSYHKTPDYYATLISNEYFSSKPATYIVEMDLNLTSLGVFGLILNNDYASTAQTTQITTDSSLLSNSILITLRQKTSADASSYTTGAVGDSKPLYLRTCIYNENAEADTWSTTTVSEGVTTSSYSMKLTIIVDNSSTNGCTVTLYADGEFLTQVNYSGDTHNVKENTSLILWAQQTTATIDNIVLKTYPVSVTAD